MDLVKLNRVRRDSSSSVKFIVIGFEKPKNESEFFDKIKELKIKTGYTNDSIKFGTRGMYYLEVNKNGLYKLEGIINIKEKIEKYERGIFKYRSLGSYNIGL